MAGARIWIQCISEEVTSHEKGEEDSSGFLGEEWSERLFSESVQETEK